MLNNDLELKLIDYKQASETIAVKLINKDTNFTEKIIKDKIVIKNIKYKIHIELVDLIETVIKSKYISKYIKKENKIFKLIDFKFNDIIAELSSFQDKFLYRVTLELVENINGLGNNYITHKSSNPILINTRYGLIDEIKLDKLNKSRYGRKIICKSEKDTIKQLKNEIEFEELNDILPIKELKQLTIHNRNFKSIENFVNNNDKFSKQMSEVRKKRIIFSTKARIFFDNKMERNNRENIFMKNEWFMGPIYSFDQNYKKLI